MSDRIKRENKILKDILGFEAHEYEPTAKAYLVLLLNSISLEELLSRLDETGGNEILAGIIARASY